jgi:hypothetical protein
MTDKWGKRLFTAGGVWLVLLGLVHSLSLLGRPAPANDTERQLLDLMAHYQFDVMGSMRSMDSFLRGFSISFMLVALVMGVLALALRRERAGLLKRVALINTLWLGVMIAVSLRYFFVLPTSFLSVALLIFAAAWLKLPAEGKG